MTIKLTACLAALLSFCHWSTLASDPSSVALFNGKDLSGWKTAGQDSNRWVYGKAAMDPNDPSKLMVVGPGEELISTNKTVNLASVASFGDCVVEFEFMVGKSNPKSTVDSNSGIKMMGIYEIQIFDSSDKTQMNKEDCGAVYSETPPSMNACGKPGTWQQMRIDFRAPRFDSTGKKIMNAKFVEVRLNGQVVQKDVEIAHGTNVSRNAPEHPTGPIYLQGDHGSVALRQLKLTPVIVDR